MEIFSWTVHSIGHLSSLQTALLSLPPDHSALGNRHENFSVSVVVDGLQNLNPEVNPFRRISKASASFMFALEFKSLKFKDVWMLSYGFIQRASLAEILSIEWHSRTSRRAIIETIFEFVLQTLLKQFLAKHTIFKLARCFCQSVLAGRGVWNKSTLRFHTYATYAFLRE